MRYALKLFYLGDSEKLEGFQRQVGKNTVEGYLLEAFRKAGLLEDLETAAYSAAGRTDRGVHALGQVVAISTPKKLFIRAINTNLPENIIVWGSKVVNELFHPRYDAISRHYCYYTHYSNEDLSLMLEGAKLLEGIHDFKLFSRNSPLVSTIREVYQIGIELKEPFLIFHLIADSFLWQMVRRIVNSLLKIGRAEWNLQDLQDLLSGTPGPNIFTTPSPTNESGALFLWDIEYPFQFEPDIKSLNQVRERLQKYIIESSLKHYYFREIYDFFSIIGEKGK
jgi:tRNA pseudouridine38-40 synthase